MRSRSIRAHTGHEVTGRYVEALSPRQQRIFLALDHYSDRAVGLFLVAATAAQWLVGTPGASILSAVALMFPTALLAYAMNRVCKRLLPKQRPNRLYHEMVTPWVRGSFPSFHSQFGAALAATFSVAIALLGPEGVRLQAGIVAALTLGIPAVLVAWSRIYLGVHDGADVRGGLALGACLGAVWVVFAVRYGWVPEGGDAWVQVAALAGFVLVLSSRERRKRQPVLRDGEQYEGSVRPGAPKREVQA